MGTKSVNVNRGVLTVPTYWNSFAVKSCTTENIPLSKKILDSVFNSYFNKSMYVCSLILKHRLKSHMATGLCIS